MTNLQLRTSGLVRRITLLCFTFAVLVLAGCDSTESPTTGRITGTITLPEGAGGDIVNTRVALFETIDEFDLNVPTFTTSTSATGDFSFNNINPDSYFISAWKDNNNTSFIDGGDYFGVIGTNRIEGFVPSRQQVVAGENTGFDVTILVLPVGFGVSVSGTYTGSASGINVSLSLTDTGGTITGAGSVVEGANNFPVTVTGTFNAPNLNLTLTSAALAGPVQLTGTVANNGASINATLNGSGLSNFTITLNRL